MIALCKPNRQPNLDLSWGVTLGFHLSGRVSNSIFSWPWLAVALLVAFSFGREAAAQDVVVYGGTPAGIAAAVAAAKNGCQVVLVEPYGRIGGMITNGLSHTDFRTLEGRTGSYLDFAKRVEAHYIQHFGSDSEEAKASFGGSFAEPKVNLLIFEAMLAENRVLVQTGRRLKAVSTSASPGSQLNHLDSIAVIDSKGQTSVIHANVFIDTSYEGDLMAMAGCQWRVGREGRDEYGESLAPPQADHQLQAYNFRFIMTNDPANRVMPKAPVGYDRAEFVDVLELLNTHKIKKVFSYPTDCIFKAQTPALPHKKYDINDVSRGLVRLSLPGENLNWPHGDAQTRNTIFQNHLNNQVGLLYFLQNDVYVPLEYREEARNWGWCRDEFEQTEHLPEQLYVREARRLLGLHVYVQRDSEHAPGDARALWHRDSIAMGDYGNNCHGTEHEGSQFGGKHTGEFYNSVPPYQIPYNTLVPREVDNLLVPGAVSSSHVGFCALRLEPIWMVMGQAAGHAAAMAFQQSSPVQAVNVRALQHHLHAAGSATIYVSDVLPGHPDFEAVQWWGSQGGLHGLEPMPAKPGQRGKNLHGQYYEATPGHAAKLDTVLDENTARRWMVIVRLAGLNSIPTITPNTTRGEFIRAAYREAAAADLLKAMSQIPRLHPRGLANTHAPGDVDNPEFVAAIVVDSAKLPGIVMDDVDAVLTGQWQYSTHTPPYVGAGYLHDMQTDKGQKSARFTPTIDKPGTYEVRMSHCTNIRRASNVQVTIHHADGKSQVQVDEQQTPEHGRLFRTLGKYRLAAGRTNWVEISNEGTEGKYVIVDAVQFIPAE